MDFLTKIIIACAVSALTLSVITVMLRNNTEVSQPKSQIETEHTVGEFANLIPFTLGRISLLGSIADTDAERALGLSNTKEIPIGVAKVFIFDTSEKWSFWMKDMNYSIDIFWLDADGQVVHVIEDASPDTYPATSFMPETPAKYVIETKAGFAKENNIGVGAVANVAPFSRRTENL